MRGHMKNDLQHYGVSGMRWGVRKKGAPIGKKINDMHRNRDRKKKQNN